MRILASCVVSVVGAFGSACYMSHPPFAGSGDDRDGGDGLVSDADTTPPDGRYYMHDAWDAIRCVDAECPDGMVLVPCGPFVQGSRVGEGVTPAEEPARVAWMSTYCIDRTEVSVAQYFACVAAGRCSGIDLALNPDLSSDNPVRGAVDVISYCSWRGHRIAVPTAAEWEKAARGGCEVVAPADCGPEDERRYPWGDQAPTCGRANFAGCAGGPLPVGGRAAGASPYGALDMAGNLVEVVGGDDLVSVPDRTYCYCAPADPAVPCVGPACGGAGGAIRGGHYDSPAENLTLSERGPYAPVADQHTGFRCAWHPPR